MELRLRAVVLIVFVDGRVHLGTAQMVKDGNYDHYCGREDTVPRTVLRQLLGQEEKPTIRADPRQLKKVMVPKCGQPNRMYDNPGHTQSASLST